MHYCSQICDNTEGDYTCRCKWVVYTWRHHNVTMTLFITMTSLITVTTRYHDSNLTKTYTIQTNGNFIPPRLYIFRINRRRFLLYLVYMFIVHMWYFFTICLSYVKSHLSFSQYFDVLVNGYVSDSVARHFPWSSECTCLSAVANAKLGGGVGWRERGLSKGVCTQERNVRIHFFL